MTSTEAVALFERGNALFEQRRVDDAIDAYRAAIALTPGYAQAHNNLGVALRARRQLDDAVAAHREAVRLEPAYASAWSNLGSALQLQGALDEAIVAYQTSIRLMPNHSTAHYNLGCALRTLRRPREATEAFRAAVRLKPNFADAQSNLGAVLREQDDLEHALEAYQQALRVRPDWGGPSAHVMHLCREMAQWTDLEPRVAALRHAITTDAPLSVGIPPFSMLMSDASPAEQLRGARQWAAHAHLTPIARPPHQPSPSDRAARPLRIGYLSSDFHEHATAYLIAGLLEAHDRQVCDITAYWYGRDDTSAMRRRLEAGCRRFVEIASLSDQEAAARIEADRIDILVDLKGLTQHARTAILRYRAAPIQIQFVGYPGTMGTPLIDYLVADRFVVPDVRFPDYEEQIVHMPDSYQPNDPGRVVGPAPSRLDAGLPETGLVFCSFNETYKITPAIFDIWMRLLQATPGAVLWLMKSNPWAPVNLRREARARGVAPERLIFAPRVPNAAHLGRLTLADLFLDTFPVNAHTTASDALWAGVPIVTCSGETFASRVAGSLLRTMGLFELMTTSLKDYERRAHELSAHPETLAALKATIQTRRHTSPLFDAARFARHLEAAYRTMWDRYLRREAPSPLSIVPVDL